MKRCTFGSKGRYRIPIRIIKNASSIKYEIKILFDYNGLKKMEFI